MVITLPRVPAVLQEFFLNRLRGWFMRLQERSLCQRVLLLASILVFYASAASSQEKPKPGSAEAPASKSQVPATKKQPTPATSAESTDEFEKAPDLEEAKDGAEQIRKRNEWFYKQRSSANGRIPAGARFKAFQHMQRMMAAEGKLVLRPDGSYAEMAPQSWLMPQGAVTSAWASIGPTPTTGGFFSPVTGRIMTIAVDPSDASGNTVLIGGAMGGIWRSTDAGATWTPVGDQNASLAMGSIAFAPSNPSIVYAGTGEQALAFDTYYGAGVLKSTNSGLTWTQTCTVADPTCPFIGPYIDGLNPGFGFLNFGGAHISYVAVSPSNPNMVLVGAQFIVEGPKEGVYCSDNGGTTWTNILPDQMSTFVGFASSTVAYAAFGNLFGSSPGAPNGNGIYKATGIGSTCSSIHFTRLTSTTLPPQSSMGRIDLGIAPAPGDTTGNIVYASIADASTSSSTNLGVFVTTNGGTSWTRTAAPDICRRQCWYDNVIKVDPNNKNIAFFGGGAVRDSSGNFSWVVRTENGGTSWSSVIPNLPGGSAGLPHVDNHAIAFFKLLDGKVRMYLGNDGGIWRTDDAEASTITWVNLNNPSLTLTQFYPSISINASTPSIAFGGTQDNGSQNYQGGTSWLDNHLCGDGGSSAVDSLIPSTVYIGCATGAPVNASYQNGEIGTFFPAVKGIKLSDFSSFIPPLATDPNAANVLYYATTKIYQSIDAGNTWTPISFDLVYGPNGNWLNVIAVEPGNSRVVYAGANNGLVYFATNVTAGGGGFASFIQVNQIGLPRRQVTAIAIDPSDPSGKTAYVAFSGFSMVGNDPFGNPINDPLGHVFKTADGGNTWKDVSCSTANCSTPAASDLPNVPVNDLVLDPEVPGTLYAATDLGVFIGNCSAMPCTWSTVGSGLPRVAVISLRLHEASRTLRAATHGRGAWDIFLDNFPFSGPRIFSLSPTSANSGGASFTLTVNGTGLTNGVIQFNGTPLATTPSPTGPDTQLSAQVSTALLVAGTPKIAVKVGSTTSNSLIFSVLAAIPALTGINPSSTPVQTSNPTTNVSIQLSGTNFASSAKVLFNGAQNGITVAAPTASCQLPTCLTATLPAALLGPFGSTNDISVLNLPPGGGQSKPVRFTVAAPPPPNDTFANASNITRLYLIDFQDSSGATTESTDPIPSCVTQFTSAQGNTGSHPNGVYNTIWYKFTPQFSANLDVNTGGSSYDTVLAIWTGAQGSFTQIACNDDISPGVIIQSQLQNVPLTAGTTYYIMVSSFGPPDPNPIALGGKAQLFFVYNSGYTPTPTITSISPTSAKSGDPGLTLTVNGTGFLSAAVVWFVDPSPNGFAQAENTTFVSTTQLTAIIPASAILLPGAYTVLVYNPPPTLNSSNGLTFTVNVGTYPAPTLSNIAPNSVVAGGLGFTLQAFGTNFASAATLNFNGSPRTTTVFGKNQLSASILASDIAAVSTAQITVSNPTPGGGPSSPAVLDIIQPNPVPTITSITPSTVQSGTNVGSLAIVGTNFVYPPNVYFNGFVNGAAFLDSTHLTAFLNPAALPPGTYPLSVIDPYPGGMSLPFNITVTPPPDFAITSSGAISQTVSAGQTATFTNAISVAAQSGFSAQVNLSCSLPVVAKATTCSVNPVSFPSGSGSATVTVTTTARGLVPPLWLRVRFIGRPQFLPVILLTILLSALLLRLARTRRQRFAGALPLAGLVLFLMLQVIGCGGGGYTSPPPPTGTPANTYTVTVTATSGTLTHSTTLTLVVN
jgi:photosystem II stability/assembly factor-like uncharacterized protein